MKLVIHPGINWFFNKEIPFLETYSRMAFEKFLEMFLSHNSKK